MAILLLVLALWYTFYSYVNRSFTISSQQSAVQFNVRMAKEKIENQVRFANHMEILEEWEPTRIDETFTEAIYVDENGALFHYHDGVADNLLEGITNDITYEITFSISDEISDHVFLSYSIKGTTDDNYYYELSTELQILNVDEETGIIKNFNNSTTGKAIIFGFDE